MLSTYPPKVCGLATFAAALEAELSRAGHRVDVVRIDDGSDMPAVGPRVTAELVNGAPESMRRAVAVLSRCDVAVVQHEYGIYGGIDGRDVVDLHRALEVPTIVIFHTVPLRPTSNQRYLLAMIGELADRVVVMTAAARERLTSLYPIAESKIVTIPHGASLPTPAQAQASERRSAPGPQLLTWGLLGPGKGIEHVIGALATLRDLGLHPEYTIAGVTHPKVFARDGDQYRRSLVHRTRAAGVAASVTFDDTYRNLAELTRFVASASVVVLPYDSRDQVTSGVLVDAIAAGRPVIATAFPHAVELLRTGAGIVVPHSDPAALADAIRAVISEPGLRPAMAAEARRLAPSLSWTAVAEQYTNLAQDLVCLSEPIAI